MNNRFNPGFNRMFKPEKLTLGLFFPLESYASDIPEMRQQESIAQLAESLGFSALWFRDVPLRDPSFGDVGQIFDPWVYLTWIASHTTEIALATGSIVLPLRHPLHVAKSAASVDRLSQGRLVLGVASGDRAIEFPAFNVNRDKRDTLYREHVELLKQALYETFPSYKGLYGNLTGHADTLPKPQKQIPILTTGYSQQNIDWIAKNADGWISYPRSINHQQRLIRDWNSAVRRHEGTDFKPFAQSLYIDLSTDPNAAIRPIHLGFRSGRKALTGFLEQLQSIGVHHVAINLKYGQRPAAEVIQEIGEEVLPHFN